MPQQTLAGKGDHSPHMMATNQMYSVCTCIGGSILASLSNLPLSLLYMYLFCHLSIPCHVNFVCHVAVRKFTVDFFFIVHFYFHHHPHDKLDHNANRTIYLIHVIFGSPLAAFKNPKSD